MPLLGAKPVITPYRGGAYHRFTGGYDCCCFIPFLSELERDYILQRQLEGIAIAKAKGLYKGRKPISHPDFNKIVSIWKNGDITAVEAMKRLGNMKPTTFYRKIKKFENK